MSDNAAGSSNIGAVHVLQISAQIVLHEADKLHKEAFGFHFTDDHIPWR
jgi:hypothetical protein